MIFNDRICDAQEWDWRILLNGKLDELEYDRGVLVSDGLSFPELKKQAWINPAAKAANDFARIFRTDPQRQGRIPSTRAVGPRANSRC